MLEAIAGEFPDDETPEMLPMPRLDSEGRHRSFMRYSRRWKLTHLVKRRVAMALRRTWVSDRR